MASARVAWGIDIGNRALKAVKLVRDGDEVRLTDFEFIEHETVLSQAGDNRESLVQTALANFVQKHDIKGAVVAAGVSGQSSFARFIKLPPVEAKKIPEIVRFEAIQQIPFPLDDVEWSYQLFQQPESPDVEVGIFAMRRELVNQHVKFFTDVDLNVQVVQTGPLAAYNAIQHDGRLSKGTAMIIDVGAENTDLIIADDNSIWLRSIAIGGNNFTETLVKAFKVPFAKAEDLKRNAATSRYAKQIFQAMRPVFADLVSEIQRSVGFYASGHKDSRIRKIIALGGTFRLPGLQKYLQQNLQLDLERVEALAAGAPAEPKAAQLFGENLLSAVGAYGLALQALGQTTVSSSLLPAAIRKDKLWKDKTKYFALGSGLAVAAAVLSYGSLLFNKYLFDQNEAVRGEITSIEGKARTLTNDALAVSGSGGPELQQIANTLHLVEGKDRWSAALRDINAALPKPQPELAAAIARNDRDAVLKITRGERRLLVVDTWVSQFDPNLATTIGSPNYRSIVESGRAPSASGRTTGGGGIGRDEFGNPIGQPAAPVEGAPAVEPHPLVPAGSSGYIVTIRLTTPNASALEANGLVVGELFKALEAIKPDGARPGLAYAVVKPIFLSGNALKDDPNRLNEISAAFVASRRALDPANQGGPPQPTPYQPSGGGEYEGATPPYQPPPYGGQPGPVTGNTPDAQEAFKDRLTGEDIREDQEITIGFAVVFNPPKFVAPPPAEGTQAASAQ